MLKSTLGVVGALVVAAAIALGVVVAGSGGPPRVPVIVQPAANQQPAAPATTAAPTTVAQTTTTAATTTTVAPTTTTAATTTTVAQTTTTAKNNPCGQQSCPTVTYPQDLMPPPCIQTQTCPTVTYPSPEPPDSTTTLLTLPQRG